MNQLRIFNFENSDFRTLLVEDTPFFVGKDVANLLGYKRADNAIRAHVDDEDKLVHRISASGQTRHMTIINESGLYSLIFRSDLAAAKRFKRWVTNEVLPKIRKTGSYEAPTNPMQILELHFEALKDTNKRVETVISDVEYLKNDVKLGAGEYDYISRKVQQKVARTIDVLGYINSKAVKKQLYKDINSGLNSVCGIQTRTQLKQKHFDKAIEYLALWEPASATKYIVSRLVEEDEDV
ncbi:BRO family protein [Jeotgalicoccus halotolerans]|uniref:BRO family protein n=1 Tax=Jeotgalicoccus halotolerans TaxID=157227 RepID=UPI003517260A